MSLILKNTVKTIDDKSKSYFVDKLKQYDYLIDEKEKKLSELEEELEKRKNGLEENKTREGKPTYDFDNSIIDLLTETNYLDKNIFAINKKIEEKFIINYENLNNNFSIYFKQKSTTKYEIELLKYLDNNCIVIESKYDGILAEFDLLIASQFIIYYIGKTLDIDVSKPKYSDSAMKIYFYKGDL